MAGRLGTCWASRCGEAARYRCPGCEVVTCSLACTKEHKAALGCLGKRSASATVVDRPSVADQHVESGAFTRLSLRVPQSPHAPSSRAVQTPAPPAQGGFNHRV